MNYQPQNISLNTKPIKFFNWSRHGNIFKVLPGENSLMRIQWTYYPILHIKKSNLPIQKWIRPYFGII